MSSKAVLDEKAVVTARCEKWKGKYKNAFFFVFVFAVVFVFAFAAVAFGAPAGLFIGAELATSTGVFAGR